MKQPNRDEKLINVIDRVVSSLGYSKKRESLGIDYVSVFSVDEDNYTCVVKSLITAKEYDVIISMNKEKDSHFVIPEVNTRCFVLRSENGSFFLQIEKIGKQVIGEGATVSGLVKVPELQGEINAVIVSKLNELIGAHNDLLTNYKTHTHPTAAPGAPSPLTVPYTGTPVTDAVDVNKENFELKDKINLHYD